MENLYPIYYTAPDPIVIKDYQINAWLLISFSGVTKPITAHVKAYIEVFVVFSLQTLNRFHTIFKAVFIDDAENTFLD